MNVTLSPDYKPTKKEPFMNSRMREYFRQKLLAWKAELLNESNDTIQHLQEGRAFLANVPAHGTSFVSCGSRERSTSASALSQSVDDRRPCSEPWRQAAQEGMKNFVGSWRVSQSRTMTIRPCST